MRRLLNATLILTIAAGLARGQSEFKSADSAVRFAVPEGWRAEESGGKIRLIPPAGPALTMVRDPAPAPSGDASRSDVLRAAAERLVKPVLSTYRYAGVRPVSVPGGSGAVFRFHGKGTKTDDDLTE